MRAERDRDRSSAAHRHADRVCLRAAGIRDDELIDAIYELFIARTMPPYPDSEGVLRELRRLGILVAVVSNCGWDIRGRFEEQNLDRYVDAFALSFEHGTVKPEPQLFEVACELLGVRPAGAAMIGDDPATDGGAASYGIAALILPKVAPGQYRGLDLAVRLVTSQQTDDPTGGHGTF
ncbi:MAG: HAD family hydrolase [Candidatus Dormibacteraceae bacterium]